MKASIEFDLPADEEAFLVAVEASRWKDFVLDLERLLICMETTDPNPDLQRAYHNLLRHMRHERALAGLTFESAATVRDLHEEHDVLWREKIDAYLKEKGLSFSREPASQQRPLPRKPHLAERKGGRNDQGEGRGSRGLLAKKRPMKPRSSVRQRKPTRRHKTGRTLPTDSPALGPETSSGIAADRASADSAAPEN